MSLTDLNFGNNPTTTFVAEGRVSRLITQPTRSPAAMAWCTRRLPAPISITTTFSRHSGQHACAVALGYNIRAGRRQSNMVTDRGRLVSDRCWIDHACHYLSGWNRPSTQLSTRTSICCRLDSCGWRRAIRRQVRARSLVRRPDLNIRTGYTKEIFSLAAMSTRSCSVSLRTGPTSGI